MRTLLLALFFLVFMVAANAESLSVRPTTIVLAAGQQAGALTLSNRSESPITAQVRVFAWNQDDNQDRLEATSALVASPPMVTIAPGRDQIVRIVRVEKKAPGGEESYRLLVDEIVDPHASPRAGVAMQIRYSLPVFAVPAGQLAPRLAFDARIDRGALLIDAFNSGNQHAQISAVSLNYADGSSVSVNPGLLGYVLPARRRQFRIPLPTDAPALGRIESIAARINGQEIRTAF